jgi:hypothetical protein
MVPLEGLGKLKKLNNLVEISTNENLLQTDGHLKVQKNENRKRTFRWPGKVSYFSGKRCEA